ncbi:MAG: hypothetical protein IIX77_02985 [Oscillospiraceae bacterium]|nr:hypothetical protein [Oscillospiraceae bacterium]
MKTKHNLFLRLFGFGTAAAILAVSLFNIKLAVRAVDTTLQEDGGLKQLVQNVKDEYINGFRPKHAFIELNGLFARLTGRTVYNQVAALSNGMLINESVGDMDTDTAAQKLAEFADFTQNSGARFVYVQAPYKLDMQNELLPQGLNNLANARADAMLENLSRLGVETLDLRPYICRDSDTLQQYFYKTDHHWNTAGGFLAFTKICQYLQIETAACDFSNWSVQRYDNWFLGSHGKRVGSLYAGTDDLLVYTPNFKTDMSMYIVNHNRVKSGDFVSTVMDTSYLDKKDYYNHNSYCMYIGGDYQLVKHRNPDAASNPRVLVLKDSFTLPVQAFLSTAVTELEVIDPRYYTGSSLAEYVAAGDFDVVIMLLNPWSMDGESYYDTGSREAAVYQTQTECLVQEQQSVSVQDQPYTLCQLQNGAMYRLKVRSVSTDSRGVVAAVCDQSDKIVSSHLFDKTYLQAANGDDFGFVVPKQGNFTLCFLNRGEEDTLQSLQGITLYQNK